MHPSAPADGSSPAPSDPIQSLAAHLDDVMAQAEIAANAERDLDAEIPTASSPRQEANVSDTDEADEDESEPDEESQEDEADEDESEDEAEQPEPAQPTRPSAQAEPPRYSRRDAARFKTELDTARGQLEQTQNQLKAHQGELAHHRTSDQQIRQLLQEQSGYIREPDGQFKYDKLRDKVLKGTASDEEAAEVARMTQWHEFAGPIFRAAEEISLRNFQVNWQSLKDLEGVGDDGLQRLNRAANSIEATKQLHALAFAAGEAKAKTAAEQTIAKLRAELKSAKTRRVASAPQPATANGAGVPSNGGFLARAIDPKTGLTNPDFDREVAQGKWLGADLSEN